MSNSLVLTLDVEEDYHGLSGYQSDANVNPEDRLPELLPRWLNLLDRYEAKATFFVLGRVAEKYPELVAEILNQGHEIGAHGYSHLPYTSLTRSEIGRDMARAREVLLKAGAQDPQGFRAPLFSVEKQDMQWFAQLLAENAFTYDSSLIGPGHPIFGESSVSNDPHHYQSITEIPVPSGSILGCPIPTGGSFFFRLLPYRATRYLLRQFPSENGGIPVLYFHPWELESGRWKLWLKGNFLSKFSHFWGRWGFRAKLHRLLDEFSTMTVQEYIRTQ